MTDPAEQFGVHPPSAECTEYCPDNDDDAEEEAEICTAYGRTGRGKETKPWSDQCRLTCAVLVRVDGTLVRLTAFREINCCEDADDETEEEDEPALRLLITVGETWVSERWIERQTARAAR
jgi:hypothetical protein